MSGTNASRPRPPDWVAIRRLYEDSGTTIAEIAASHGVTPSAIQKRRVADGWKMRSRRSRVQNNRQIKSTSGRSGLISRLLKVVDRNLKLLEMRMETDEPVTAADRERETRAISALTRTIGKLTELQAETDSRVTAGKNNSGSKIDDSGEADRLRLEIAERILRIGERYASR